MPSQFEILRETLDRMEGKLNKILDSIGGDLELDDEVYEEPQIVPKDQTRTHVLVEGERVPWAEVPKLVIEAIRISNNMGEEYRLYRDPSGGVRIAVSDVVKHRMVKGSTYQQPVPTEGGGFDAVPNLDG